jgi:hypothetical protein
VAEIIEVEPTEAKGWLKSNASWKFEGKINKISHEKILEFIDDLYKAGCKEVLISEYDWEIEPVYEGDEFCPDMLIIRLPSEIKMRRDVYRILNHSFPELKGRISYKDTGLEGIWYFFEPEPQKITVGGKEITWY